jgi:hypothetical protein
MGWARRRSLVPRIWLARSLVGARRRRLPLRPCRSRLGARPVRARRRPAGADRLGHRRTRVARRDRRDRHGSRLGRGKPPCRRKRPTRHPAPRHAGVRLDGRRRADDRDRRQPRAHRGGLRAVTGSLGVHGDGGARRTKHGGAHAVVAHQSPDPGRGGPDVGHGRSRISAAHGRPRRPSAHGRRRAPQRHPRQTRSRPGRPAGGVPNASTAGADGQRPSQSSSPPPTTPAASPGHGAFLWASPRSSGNGWTSRA